MWRWTGYHEIGRQKISLRHLTSLDSICRPTLSLASISIICDAISIIHIDYNLPTKFQGLWSTLKIFPCCVYGLAEYVLCVMISEMIFIFCKKKSKPVRIGWNEMMKKVQELCQCVIWEKIIFCQINLFSRPFDPASAWKVRRPDILLVHWTVHEEAPEGVLSKKERTWGANSVVATRANWRFNDRAV